MKEGNKNRTHRNAGRTKNIKKMFYRFPHFFIGFLGGGQAYHALFTW
jgi:hypothetical protein